MSAPLRPLPSTLELLAALLPSWLGMAWLVAKAQWFWSHRADLSFGWIVLMLCAYLFWEAWEKRPAPEFRLGLSALPLGLAALGILFVVQIYQAAFGTNAASMQGLALGILLAVAANLRFVFGWRGVRHFAMAFGFILIALPLPSIVYNPVVSFLQAKIASANVELLNLLGVPAQQVGSLIRLPSGTVGIDEACSGIRSLQSTLMATIFVGYLTLQRHSLRLALLCSGLGLAVIGNLLRSLFLSLTANSQGTEAVQRSHDAAGWSILLFTVVGVSLLAWLFNHLEKRLRALASEARRPPAPDGE